MSLTCHDRPSRSPLEQSNAGWQNGHVMDTFLVSLVGGVTTSACPNRAMQLASSYGEELNAMKCTSETFHVTLFSVTSLCFLTTRIRWKPGYRLTVTTSIHVKLLNQNLHLGMEVGQKCTFNPPKLQENNVVQKKKIIHGWHQISGRGPRYCRSFVENSVPNIN